MAYCKLHVTCNVSYLVLNYVCISPNIVQESETFIVNSRPNKRIRVNPSIYQTVTKVFLMTLFYTYFSVSGWQRD